MCRKTHRVKSSEEARRIRLKRLNRGLCPACANELAPGKTLCIEHLEKAKNYRIEHKTNLKGSATKTKTGPILLDDKAVIWEKIWRLFR
jgi:hypothetical protein